MNEFKKQMDPKDMSLFVTIVQLGGFSKAAEQHKVSVAAISKRMRKLEETIGIDLFKTDFRNLRLSEFGEKYYEICHDVVKKLQEVGNLIDLEKNEVSGTLNILCSTAFAAKYIQPHLPEFIKQYPDLKLNIEYNERIPNLARENTDLSIGIYLK